MSLLKPRKPAPALEVQTLAGETWRLADREPDHFTMIVFYRGLHCPVCSKYLKNLEDKLGELTELGVDVIAVSGDTRERAARSQRGWKLADLTIGYGQSIDSMRRWGLFVSKGIKEEEPEQFGEPGLFLVKPDGELYWSAINSMPFGRPQIAEVTSSIGWIIDNDYPARGEA